MQQQYPFLNHNNNNDNHSGDDDEDDDKDNNQNGTNDSNDEYSNTYEMRVRDKWKRRRYVLSGVR